jgi:hypothetical protein
VGPRPRFERRERGPSFFGQAQHVDAPIRRPRRPRQQPARFEAAHDPADVAGVEPQVAGDLAGGRPIAVRELVEEAHFGEREGTVEMAVPEQPDVAGVKAVERADRGNAVHARIVAKIVDCVKYLRGCWVMGAR